MRLPFSIFRMRTDGTLHFVEEAQSLADASSCFAERHRSSIRSRMKAGPINGSIHEISLLRHVQFVRVHVDEGIGA